MRRACLVLAASGCSVNQSASTLPADHAGETVEVETVEGARFQATVTVNAQGWWLQSGAGVVPIDRVAAVRNTRHGRGALHGIGLGVLIGAAIGIASGLAEGDEACEGEECEYTLTAREQATLGGLVYGALGGIVGLVIGAIKGSDDIYTFGSAQQFRVTPSGPPGSAAGLTVTF